MKVDYVHKDTLTATDYVELNKKNELLLMYNQTLLKENQKLKKDYLNAVADYETTMAEKEQLKAQQKEFIKYLEDEINKEKDDLEKLCELYKIPKEHNNAYEFVYSYINKMEEVLQKFKEIIGDDK